MASSSPFAPVSLVEERPSALAPDPSRHERLEILSSVDGESYGADLYLPTRPAAPLPVVVAPHPIGWTAREDYAGGLTGLKRGYHRGWCGLAEAYGVIVLMPDGHSRRVELCSLAYSAQIDDIAQMIDALTERGLEIDPARVYACGLSMGGLEALVLCGKFPQRFAAAAAFNPIVDLAAWQEDLARTQVEEIRAFGTAERIVEEVGATPEEAPEAYAERGAFDNVEALASLPLLLVWSEHDLIVPRQATHHAYALYRTLKARSASAHVVEWEHTAAHEISELTLDVRWQIHEWCDYEFALRWLLHHSKGEVLHEPA